MKYAKPILAILLILTFVTVVAAGQKKKNGKKGQSNPPDQITIGPVVSDPTEVKVVPPPPPPATKSRLVVTTIPTDAELLINDRVYKTGQFIDDIKPGNAKIVVRHADFEEQRETIWLKRGQSIVKNFSLVSKFGSIILGGIPEKAQIFINDQEQPLEASMRKGDEITLPRIPVGKQRLRITHPDYLEWQENCEIKPGTPTVFTPDLQRALAKLTVTTLPGATIYLNGERHGEVLPEGLLAINDIAPGDYELLVVKNGYQPEKLSQKLNIGSNTISIKLKPVPNSTAFDEYFFALNNWQVPGEWRIDKEKLVISGGTKLGMLKNRNYRDFEAQFSFSMRNGKGAAWVVRMQDSKNYYLFYLVGPKAGKFAGKFCTYICQDGKFDFDNPQSCVPADVIKLAPQSTYTMRIVANGNKISHYITPESESDPKRGKEQPIGVFEDETNLFLYGNIGFFSIEGEEITVDDFHIRPLDKPEDKASLNR